MTLRYFMRIIRSTISQEPTHLNTTFDWSDEFSVAIPEIDEQHKVLFQLVNQLSAAIHQRHGSEACQAILGRLVEYTRIHFSLEESLMRMANYPGFVEHKQLHERLIADVVALDEKMHAGKAKISFELLHFLRVWLTRHIQHDDKEYATFFRREGFGRFERRTANGPSAASRAGMPRRRADDTSADAPWWKFW
jgi:hemerythrin